jgi:hypothetical protein
MPTQVMPSQLDSKLKTGRRVDSLSARSSSGPNAGLELLDLHSLAAPVRFKPNPSRGPNPGGAKRGSGPKLERCRKLPVAPALVCTLADGPGADEAANGVDDLGSILMNHARP